MKIVVYVRPHQKQQYVQCIGPNLYEIQEYEVSLKNLPIDGKCNIELIEVLSDHFNIRKSCIKIISGHKSRCKIVEILN